MIRTKDSQPSLLLLAVAFCVLIFLAGGIAYWRFELHKHALERIAGHPVSNWDAYWTQ